MFTTDVYASKDALHTDGDTKSSPCTGLAANALPEIGLSKADSQTGVSTRNALTEPKSWYILRTTYGQVQKAYDYIVLHGGIAFYPTIFTSKTIKGVEHFVESARIPNIFFAYGTFDEIKSFVYDNVHLPFLRFYYGRHHDGTTITKEPLTIPVQQLESLRIINDAEKNDILLYKEKILKFKTGQLVRVKAGDFKGVVGRVARFQGQLRVGIIVEDLMTVITAYIPKDFLEFIEE